MSDISAETIAAIATPSGEGGIGVVRLSGDQAFVIADRITRCRSGCRVSELKGYQGAFAELFDPEEGPMPVDEAVVMVMKAPKSFTGENVVEFSCHGGSIILKKVLQICLSNGARLAEAGEFTRRAFLNGRLDLTQAENVLSLISAKTEKAYEIARKQLSGKLSDVITEYRDRIAEILSNIEASIDFPEENITPKQRQQILKEIQILTDQFETLITDAKSGIRTRQGISVVLTGLPNAGKSSLMNELANNERVIVSARPGTTRDVIEETLEIGGYPVRLSDTAGIIDSQDELDMESVRRSLKVVEEADLIAFVTDSSREPDTKEVDLWNRFESKSKILVLNKSDISTDAAIKKWNSVVTSGVVRTSCTTRSGLSEFADTITQIFRSEALGSDETPLIDSVRQLKCLEDCMKSLQEGSESLSAEAPEECVARDLREALDAIGKLVGEVVNDDILGLIFSKFCIGK